MQQYLVKRRDGSPATLAPEQEPVNVFFSFLMWEGRYFLIANANMRNESRGEDFSHFSWGVLTNSGRDRSTTVSHFSGMRISAE